MTTQTASAQIIPFPVKPEARERLNEIEAKKFDAQMDVEIAEIHSEVLRKERQQYGTNDLEKIGRQIISRSMGLGYRGGIHRGQQT